MRPVLEVCHPPPSSSPHEPQAKFISENIATDLSRVLKAIQRSRSFFRPTPTDSLLTPHRDAFLADSLDEETLLSMTGSWNKFSALIELLECNLSDISEWLPKYAPPPPPSSSLPLIPPQEEVCVLHWPRAHCSRQGSVRGVLTAPGYLIIHLGAL
jgi:hypothetical protein